MLVARPPPRCRLFGTAKTRDEHARVAAGRARMSEDPPECYICTETLPPPSKSNCKCTDRYVHEKCLLRMIETRARAPDRPACPTCPVCAAPFNNVVVRTRVVGVTLWSVGGCVCGLAVVFVAMLGCALHTLAAIACHRTLSHVSEAVALGASTFLATLALGTLAIIARMCASWGPRGLAASMLVRRAHVHLLPF